MTSRLQQRRDTATNWTSNNPTLANGEIGYETDTKKFKIGDGSTAWTSLAYAYTAGGGIVGFNAQTGTTYTLVVGDVNKLVTASNTGGITVTIPISVFSANDVINVQQINTGQVTFAAASGATVTSNGATVAAPKLRAQYSACSIVCTVGGATPSFTVIGDIA